MQKNVHAKKVLSIFIIVTLIFTMMPMSRLPVFAEDTAASPWNPTTEEPALVVTGDKLVTEGAISADDLTAGIANEKSYTYDQLGAIETKEVLYSAINTTPTKSIFLGKGTSVEKLLEASNYTAEKFNNDNINFVAKDGYTVVFDPSFKEPSTTKGKPLRTPSLGTPRYYYPNLASDSEADKVAVPTILAWEQGGVRGITNIPTTTAALSTTDKLLLMTGQQNISEQNNPLFNKTVTKIVVGNNLPSILKMGIKTFNRADLLLMPRTTESYTYPTKSGNKTEYARGIPLVELLKEYHDADTVKFITTDATNNAPITVGDLRAEANQYLLAYEKGASANDLTGIYDSGKDSNSDKRGYLTVYGQGKSPIKMVCEIQVTVNTGTDFTKSPYKHINNGGITDQNGPYDIAAITGATLTVEGPGVKGTTPLSMREVESENTGVFRGNYTDNRNDQEKTFTYEGIKLLHILEKMSSGANSIQMTDHAYQVEIKNRVRQTIATFTLQQLREAESKGKPVIIAYGTSKTDGSDIAPFVFDGGSGYKDSTENDDGCVKLVYDKNVITDDVNSSYKEFGNMAYIYVAEAEEPGFKHDHAPYISPYNSKYVVSVTGDTIGREINYTVDQLESMVEYDPKTNAPKADGIGYRDEYSLANNSYWYVNKYEGVKLWDLLLKSGLSSDKATDANTQVSFSATDGYTDFDKFTLKQVADPNQFGFYEKNPNDLRDGKYVPVESDLKKTGYPVLVSYGVNGYPYVADKNLEGYKSGLSNDGGPLRIISGKTSYNHANGSKQAKLLDKIVVGTNKNIYSTHKYNPNKFGPEGNKTAVYQEIAANNNLSVKVYGDDTETPMKSLSYTVGAFEDFLYGSTVTNATFKEARVKDFYVNSSNANDLYEGMNLKYFLTNIVEIPGTKGTVTFGNAEGKSVTISLQEAMTLGKNSISEKTDLAPMIAFSKNGSPMVADENSTGYESTVTLGSDNNITIHNSDGPLALLIPEINGSAVKSLAGINLITVNLVPDKYAHTKAPYNALAHNTLTVTGAGTRLAAEKNFTVEELEGKQSLAVTGDYNVLNKSSSNNQIRYRGISLYDFLKSDNVGLKTNADKVILTCSDGTELTLSLSDLIKSNYVNGQKPSINNLKTILAYGSASVDNPDPEDGKALVTEETEAAGYDDAFGNSGGPLKFVIGQTNASDINSPKILKNVVKIEVTASELTSWKHNVSPIYSKYLTNNTAMTLTVKNGSTELLKKTYTLGALEDMDSLIERDTYETTIKDQVHEGINIWKFIQQEAGTISGIKNPGTIKVVAADGFSKDIITVYDLDQVINGVKNGNDRKPIIVAYAANGLPLVKDASDEGYAGSSGNGDGPLRSITHGNQGACLKNTVGIEVDLAGGGTPAPTYDFIIKGSKESNFGIKDIKSLPDSKGKVEKSYSWYDKTVVTNQVKGALLSDLLKAAGISGDGYSINILTTDDFSHDTYKNISMSDIISKEYFLAYDVDGLKVNDLDKKGKAATVRIYRKLEETPTSWNNKITNIKGIEVTNAETGYHFKIYATDGSNGNLPTSGIRSVISDKKGGMWIGMYGAGLAHIDANETVTRYTAGDSSPIKLASNYVVDMALDAEGGLWITQCGDYTVPNSSKGVAYIKDNGITFYDTSKPNTIPNNYVQSIKIDSNGAVWFGSFGGLTKYVPSSNTWKTWTKADGLPSQSMNSLEFDGKGGVWVGGYPDSEIVDTKTIYKGGYAHIAADGTIKTYFPEESEHVNGEALADFWVRSIAIDGKGGTWIVRSGSKQALVNQGGRVDYIAANGKVTHYTGKSLIPDLKTAENNPEIRTVAVDIAGDLWFGTSGIGLYKCSPEGTVIAKYNGTNKDWPNTSGYNNIYALHIENDGTVYVGSSNGVVANKFKIDGSSGSGGNVPAPEIPAIYDLVVDGDDISGEKGFTLEDIKSMSGKITANYSSLNNYGTKGTTSFTGIPVETLLSKVGLNSSAKSIKIIAQDGYYRQFNLDKEALGVYSKDKDGNPMILAWKEGSKDIGLQLVVGQPNSSYINKELWVSGVKTIRIGNKTVKPGGGSPGKYDTGAEVKEEIKVAANDKGEVSISADTMKSTQGNLKIEGKGDNPTVVFDASTTKQLFNAGGPITGTLKTASYDEVVKTLPESSKKEVKDLIGDRPIVSLEIKVNGKAVTNFNGSVKVSIPYTLKSSEDKNAIVIYYIDKDGKPNLINNCHYDEKTKSIIFKTNHFSVFAVGYNMSHFVDTKEHWSKDYVTYLSSRNIINGVSDNSFAPNENITRAQFAKILASIANIDISKYNTSKFTDVQGFYSPYITWANEAGIVNGIGNGNFAPNQNITREQIALMISRYVSYSKLTLPKTGQKIKFIDDTNISTVAYDAVNELTTANIISGEKVANGVAFNPRGNAKRGEAAKMLSVLLQQIAQ